MSSEHHTTLYNIFNILGYFLTLFVTLTAVIGWLPILICFYSPLYSIGWNEGWIGRWALLELLLFGSLVLVAITMSALRLDLRHLPAGWHFLRLLSIWPTADETFRFGRAAASADPNQGAPSVNDEDDDDRRMPAGRPGRYSSVPPFTTVTGKTVTVGNVLNAAVEHHLEEWREKWEKKQVERQIETLEVKAKANRLKGEYLASEVDWQHAEERARQRHDLERGRYLREAAWIKRDINDVENPPEQSRPQSKRSREEQYKEELARAAKSGTMGGKGREHRQWAEEFLKEFVEARGGPDNLAEEDKEFMRTVREDAAQKDEGRG